jgi:hypothetical protein
VGLETEIGFCVLGSGAIAAFVGDSKTVVDGIFLWNMGRDGEILFALGDAIPASLLAT